MPKSLVALIVFGMVAVPAAAQVTPAVEQAAPPPAQVAPPAPQAPPVVTPQAPQPPKPAMVKKVVCERVDTESTGSRLGATRRTCRTIEVPADSKRRTSGTASERG